VTNVPTTARGSEMSSFVLQYDGKAARLRFWFRYPVPGTCSQQPLFPIPILLPYQYRNPFLARVCIGYRVLTTINNKLRGCPQARQESSHKMHKSLLTSSLASCDGQRSKTFVLRADENCMVHISYMVCAVSTQSACTWHMARGSTRHSDASPR
jgi:hypothetical protein